METGKTNSLYYKRVIWLKDQETPREFADLFINLLRDNIYLFKNLDIVLNIQELVDLRHTKTVYEYFEYLSSLDNDIKTLCIIHHKEEYLNRNILLSRVTKMWTPFSTAYINYDVADNISCNRSFNYIIESDNLINKLTRIIELGK